MAKESFYFTHDYSSRNDPKLQKVLMKLGHEGKSVYWDLVEMLYEEGGYLQINECENYAFALRTHQDCIAKLISDFDLFKKDDKNFWSESILRRLDKRDEKSKKASDNAKSRWEKANASKINADASKSDAIKEKKVKEIKEKESKVNKSNSVSIIPDEKSSGEYNECKLFFMSFYAEKEKTDYYFQAKDGKKLTDLIKKIEFKVKEKNSGQKESSEVIRGFQLYVKEAYERSDHWVKSNFSLTTLDSKFNEIFKQLKNGKQQPNTISERKNSVASLGAEADRILAGGST